MIIRNFGATKIPDEHSWGSGGQRRAMGQPKHAERNHRRATWSRVSVERKGGWFCQTHTNTKKLHAQCHNVQHSTVTVNIFGIKGTLVAPEYLEFSLHLSSFNWSTNNHLIFLKGIQVPKLAPIVFSLARLLFTRKWVPFCVFQLSFRQRQPIFESLTYDH